MMWRSVHRLRWTSIPFGRFIGNDPRHRFAVDHLLLLEDTGDLVKGRFVGVDELERGCLGTVEESPDIGVDQVLDVRAQVP